MPRESSRLTERAARQRQHTIDLVKKAIVDLEAEGYIVSIPLLRERTGLARQTLYTAHVQSLLADCRRKSLDGETEPPEAQTARLVAENGRLRAQIDDGKREYKCMAEQFRAELAKKEKTCEFLRGEIVRLQEQVTLIANRSELRKPVPLRGKEH